jgi:hypothetical protein
VLEGESCYLRILTEDDSTTIYKLIGSKYATSNVVPVDYVADILALAVTKAEAGKIYNITNPAPFTNFHFFNAY